MKRLKIWPGDKCPNCGDGLLFDPHRDSIDLPPTGGDFDYCDSNPTLTCDKCGKEFPTKVKRRNWLDNAKVEYYLPKWEE
jgi:hypothetical protein